MFCARGPSHDHDLGQSTSEMLKLGHTVEWVTSADAAFKSLSRNQFDAAIVDLSLGADSAVTMIKALQRFGKPLPPLIIFSAQPISMIRDAVKDTGAAIALQKPCSAARSRSAGRSNLPLADRVGEKPNADTLIRDPSKRRCAPPGRSVLAYFRSVLQICSIEPGPAGLTRW